MRRFGQLLNQRWAEAQWELGLRPGMVRLTWETNDGYPHFKKKRGFGVTFHMAKTHCHFMFPQKLMRASRSRQDGIIRHEIGHVIDLCCDAGALDGWASLRGYVLPSTPERRADAIAEAVWREPLYYDKDLVQSTMQRGSCPRPRHLGL